MSEVSKINEWDKNTLNTTEIRELIRTHALDKTGDEITGDVVCPTPNADSDEKQIVNKEYIINVQPYFGTYSGTDLEGSISGQDIDLGFKPSCVIISNNGHNREHLGYSNTNVTYICTENNDVFSFNDNGFHVKSIQKGHVNSGRATIYGLNDFGDKYTFIAFKEVM